MGEKLIIDMKFRSLQEAYTSIYNPKPRFSDYFPHESRLVIIERQNTDVDNISAKTRKLMEEFAGASNGMLKVPTNNSYYSLAYINRKGARFALTDLGKQQTKESFNFDFVKQIAESIGASIEDTIGIPPKGLAKFNKTPTKDISKSSSFNTYYISKNGIELPVVVCVSFNRGIDFEETLFKDFENQLENKLIPGSLLQKLFERMKIADPENITVNRTAGKAEKRHIGFLEADLKDVGKEIADFTFKNKKTNKEYYISLKNKSGITFGNKGINGVFAKTQTKTQSADSDNQIELYTVTPGHNKELDPFFDSLGDKKVILARICNGLQDYVNGLKDPSITTAGSYIESNINASTRFKEYVTNLIKTGLGYGYYYVKEKSASDYIFIDLTTKDKLEKFINENIQIAHITIQYPYRVGPGDREGSKAFIIRINAKNGGVYEIACRSKTSTEFLPKEMVLSVKKFETNDKEENHIHAIPPNIPKRSK